MVSIKDVAKLAGVSIATVSRTINNKDRVNQETRERVQRAIEKTGFSPNALAQNFRRGRTNFIMVVLPSIGDPFFAGIVKGIQSIAQQKGYNVLFSETRMNSAEFTNMLVSRQADGMILLATVPPSGVEVLSRERHRALPDRHRMRGDSARDEAPAQCAYRQRGGGQGSDALLDYHRVINASRSSPERTPRC